MDKKPFYLIKRKLPSGKSIYYWYYYDRFGKRTTPQSTGLSKKNDAFNYCINELQKLGKGSKKIKFKTFAEGWFEQDHYWMKLRAQSKVYEENTIILRKRALNLYLRPYFGEMILTDITEEDVLNFRQSMIDKKLSPNYINATMSTFKVMLNEALNKELITKNPITKNISLLQVEHKREAFTLNELKYLFSNKWKTDSIKYFIMVQAVLGLRFSEARALQPEQFKGGYVLIDRQYYHNKGVKGVKTDENRFVTIPPRFEKFLLEHCNGQFIFSSLNPMTPVNREQAERHFYKHFSKEMLEQKADRELTFHALRYFFNTYLLSNNINESKVNFCMGHSSGTGSMAALYTSWRPEMYSDVLKLQEKLLDELIGVGD